MVPIVKKKEIETARVRTQGPLKETAKVGTLVHLKQTARERSKRTFREPVERWRIQKKWKDKQWKKKKKKKEKKKREVQKKQLEEKGERIVSFLAAKLKEEEKEKKGRKSEQRPRTTQVWGKSGSLLFSFCLWHKTGCVSLQQKDCRKGRR